MIGAPVPTDPWSAGIMALGSVATKAVTPGSAQAASTYSSVFDTSGWSINFGSGSASTDASKQTLPAAAAGVAGVMNSPALLLLAGVALVLYLNK
jgi:hypothetical protein